MINSWLVATCSCCLPACLSTLVVTFYRAMHCSAKRDVVIACRPSVRPSVRLSVTLVDQDNIGWKSWKLIARTISSTPSLFVAQRPATYSQGNMWKFGESISAIWCIRYKINIRPYLNIDNHHSSRWCLSEGRDRSDKRNISYLVSGLHSML